MPKRTLTVLGLAFAALALLGVNLWAGLGLGSLRADVTENRLYTISDTTRQALALLDEPVTVKLFVSRALAERAPAYARHADRVTALLRQYGDISGGRLQLTVIDPERFSDEEDLAVAAGLQGVPLGAGDGAAYFGLIGSNSTDDNEVIPFLALERQDFLEYDLAKMVLKLAQPGRRTVGLVSGLPILGGVDPATGQTPKWLIATQLEEFFDLKSLGAKFAAVPDDVDLLLIVSPDELDPEAVKAIDQYALAGKPVIVFADPFSEVRQFGRTPLAKNEAFARLLAAWGVSVEAGHAVGDVANARQVQFVSRGQPTVAAFVVWLTLGRDSFDSADPVFSQVERLVMATAGALSQPDGATTTFTPLIRSSDQAMLIATGGLTQPDPLALLQSYLPGGEALTLAARLTGRAATAFADQAPERREGDINVLVVGDSDMLFDSFWAEAQDIGGQRLVVPRANNADLLLNAIEAMTGGAALTGLRGRGIEDRPFSLVQAIRARAESRYRQQEELLNRKLAETQGRIRAITERTEQGPVVLTEADKEAILGFRHELVGIRQELRGVQRALRQDIDRLGLWVKVLNVAAVPVLIGLAGIAGLALRRRRTGARP